MVTRAVVFVEGEEALVELGGIPLLERLLRTLERAGIREALLHGPEAILTRVPLAPNSARPRLSVTLSAAKGADSARFAALSVTAFVRADYCYDPRLLDALLVTPPPAALRDGSQILAVTLSEPSVTPSEAKGALSADGKAVVEVARLDPYHPGLRRTLRPYWFAAPPAADRASAEAVLLDAAQKGSLDLPARVHAPIENLLVRALWHTRVTPNQVTLLTTLVAWVATALFATGRLGAGVLVALLVGVLDGVDGKLARVTVATSELGRSEHYLDWLYEFSWWAALAWHFRRSGEVPSALLLLGVLLAADLTERAARRVVKRASGRDPDTLGWFGAGLRLIGGRRNIYIWMFAVALLLGRPAQGFVLICVWGAVTAAAHLMRALLLRQRTKPASPTHEHR